MSAALEIACSKLAHERAMAVVEKKGFFYKWSKRKARAETIKLFRLYYPQLRKEAGLPCA